MQHMPQNSVEACMQVWRYPKQLFTPERQPHLWQSYKLRQKIFSQRCECCNGEQELKRPINLHSATPCHAEQAMQMHEIIEGITCTTSKCACCLQQAQVYICRELVNAKGGEHSCIHVQTPASDVSNAGPFCCCSKMTSDNAEPVGPLQRKHTSRRM